jgi:NAD(P)-dependent dehydrogenase (short-subunit alcohol dehydrogenase family)
MRKSALVTGAGTGIGRAVALRLAVEGYDLALFDRDERTVQNTAAEIQLIGRLASTYVGDVANEPDVTDALENFNRNLGPIELLVNNAGILRTGGFLDLSTEDWVECIRINLGGTIFFCRAVLPAMVERQSGTIINVASWTGKRGVANHSAYAVTKAAILNLTQSLAEEFGPNGIRVNAICPGIIVDTRMREEAEQLNRDQGLPDVTSRTAKIPLQRGGLPKEIADAVAFLASNQASYITGESLNVTGGLWMT